MDNNKRNFLIQNKVMGVLEIKIDSLENQVNSLNEKVSSFDHRLSNIEAKITNLKNETDEGKTPSQPSQNTQESHFKTELKKLNQKLDILQGIAFFILLGIVIDIFSKPLLAALTP